MPEIKHGFIQGKMNKDLDERLLPNGQYRDAVNIEVSTSDDSGVGNVQNIMGNTQVDGLNLGSYSCVGSIADEKNNKLYWFVESTSKDAIFEYDSDTLITSAVLIDVNKLTNPVLKFEEDEPITGINIIDDLLFWTDGTNEPKKINIGRCKDGSPDAGIWTQTQLRVNGVNIRDIREEDITVIKKRPTKAPTLELLRGGRDGLITTEVDVDFSFNNAPLAPESEVTLSVPRVLQDGFGDFTSISIVGTASSSNPGWHVPTNQIEIHNPVFPIDVDAIVKNNSGISGHSSPGVIPFGTEVTAESYDASSDILTLTLSNTVAADWPAWAATNTTLSGVNTGCSGSNIDHDHCGPFLLTNEYNTNGWNSSSTGIYGSVNQDYINLDYTQFNPSYQGPNWSLNDILLLSVPVHAGSLPENFQVKGIIEGIEEIAPTTYSTDFGTIDYNLKLLTVSDTTPIGSETYDVTLEDLSPSLFQKTLIRFACRYKYEDGEYSAFGPFTQPAFLPHEFSFHPTKEPYNTGMINRIKSIILKDFIAADIPDDVVQVDLLYKEENSTVIYSIDSIKKDDPNTLNSSGASGSTHNHWTVDGSHTNSEYKGQYKIENENIYAALPQNQLLRPWDNVPRAAKAQEISGNRLIYGNYLQNYNMIDSNNVEVKPIIQAGYRTRKFPLSPSQSEQGKWLDFTYGLESIKSLRNYQLGVVYGDEYGRETPVFTHEDASITIPWDSDPSPANVTGNARLSNQLTVALSGAQPDWAKYYKVFVKQTSDEYYNLAMDRVYKAEDDGNLWISFPSSDRNKIQEDDYIILKKRMNAPVNSMVQYENKFKVIDIKDEAPDFVRYEYKSVGKGGGTSSILSNLFSSASHDPAEGIDTLHINKANWTSNTYEANGADLYTLFSDRDIDLSIIFTKPSGQNTISSERYEVSSVELISSGDTFKLKLNKPITPADGWVESSSGTLEPTMSMTVYKTKLKSSEEYEGRFFVKILADSITNQHIESQVEQFVNYRISSAIDCYWLADGSTTGFDWDDGVVGRSYNWTQNTDAANGSSSFPTTLTNHEDGWNELLDFDGTVSKGGWFIDNMFMVAAQPTVIAQGNDPYDAYQSGRLWKNGCASGTWCRTGVNGLEGIVTTNANTGPYRYINAASGYPYNDRRRWLNSIQHSNSDDFDDTYNGNSGGNEHTFMHLSFSNVGVDLHDGSFPTNLVNATAGTDLISDNLQNIRSSHALQSAYVAIGLQPDIFLDNSGNWTNQNTNDIENQWNPAYTDTTGEVQKVIDNLKPGKKFVFDGSETIYEILKVTKKHIYNHTAWNQGRQSYGGAVGPYGSISPTTILNFPNPNDNTSVHHYARMWAEELIYNLNNATSCNGCTEQTNFEDAIKRFGNANNRRVTYIIELDKDPRDAAVNGGVNPLTTATPTTSVNMRFVEGWVDPNSTVISDDPAIWETEPKGNSDLDIYYEASQAIPLEIDSENIESELLAPIGSAVHCAISTFPEWNLGEGDLTIKDYLNWSDLDASQQAILTSAGISDSGVEGDIIELDPGFETYNLTYNSNDASSIAGNNIYFHNRVVQFGWDKNNGGTTSAKIESIIEIDESTTTANGRHYITKVMLKPKLTLGQNVSLPYYNCISFGNGVESDRIRDDFNTIRITNGVKASATLEEQYKEEIRKGGLIYSGLYNSTGGINNLNQFIMAEKITKDLNPSYGSIQKLHTRDTNLITLCEDKCLKVLVQKDALFNADGSPQLLAKTGVLGQAVPFVGEYGISKNPESFASYAYRAYFTDKQRGAVMRLSQDGLTPISDAGMRDYFKDNLKQDFLLIGSYDAYKDNYNLTMDTAQAYPSSKTVSFSEDVRGWVSFKSFVPESGLSMAGDYYTIKGGELYKHHDNNTRNSFYGAASEESSITAILNDSPGVIKTFNTLNYNGSQSKIDEFRTFQTTSTFGVWGDELIQNGKFSTTVDRSLIEEVTDGDFPNNTTAWSLNNAVIINNEAKIEIDGAGSMASVSQPISFTEGKEYKVTFDAKGTAANNIRLQSNPSTGAGGLTNANALFQPTTSYQTYSFTWIANASCNYISFERNDFTQTNWDFYIDNVSVHEVITQTTNEWTEHLGSPTNMTNNVLNPFVYDGSTVTINQGTNSVWMGVGQEINISGLGDPEQYHLSVEVIGTSNTNKYSNVYVGASLGNDYTYSENRDLDVGVHNFTFSVPSGTQTIWINLMDGSSGGGWTTFDNVSLIAQQTTFDISDAEFYNLSPETGWYASEIKTDLQEGTLNEFIKKEGKWFNYIKGTSDPNTITQSDIEAFNFQGIGSVSSNKITLV